jgi:hypothetical protein
MVHVVGFDIRHVGETFSLCLRGKCQTRWQE